MSYRGKHHHVKARKTRRRIVMASAACAVAASATVIVIVDDSGPAVSAAPTGYASLDVTRSRPDEVSRDYLRSAPASPSMSPSLSPSPSPTRQGPVAGLTQAQTDNAVIIVRVGRQRNLSKQALVIALATALQESNLYNAASSAVPESLRYPHQSVEVDADSVGLFQQRPSQGWGTVAQLMDPATSAGLFYGALVRVPGWQSMSVTDAAQAVQKSAFPDAYQKHEAQAEQIVAAL